jgi:hypothetical protein
MGNVAGRGGESERLSGGINAAEQSSTLNPRPSPIRIDANSVHEREVEHEAPFGYGQAQDAVASASHPDLQAAVASETNRVYDVGGVRASGDDRWTPIDHSVPHTADFVVCAVGRQHQLALESIPQGGDIYFVSAHVGDREPVFASRGCTETAIRAFLCHCTHSPRIRMWSVWFDVCHPSNDEPVRCLWLVATSSLINSKATAETQPKATIPTTAKMMLARLVTTAIPIAVDWARFGSCSPLNNG